ncbi:DUF6090 family protein [Robiginitalea sp. M366]|uniref:DUF6090 family protein n=1 Tax=Robiginitalea aestuariiviva TaxID=3036903 RepID=UPI00240E7D7F|nr:DUF6090 family protein [Robiginitalea aestuariiviva]MDG1572650.1 DUF6090 family protein [Robiginitalea aestuariiviva]
MLQVFRRLRMQLLHNDSFRHYLGYALGEIVLLVLGIFMALQLNNWNERRLARDRLAHYLVSLEQDLAADVATLDHALAVNGFRLYGIQYLLEHGGMNAGPFTEMPWWDASVNNGLHGYWEGPYPTVPDSVFTQQAFCWLGRGFGGASFNRGVINELYATGSFSNIPDEGLKREIADYYRYLGQRLEGYAIEEHEEWANEVTRFFRDTYGIFTLDVSGLEDPLGRIRGQKDAEHHLRYLALEVNYHLRWADEARQRAKRLLNHLETL